MAFNFGKKKNPIPVARPTSEAQQRAIATFAVLFFSPLGIVPKPGESHDEFVARACNLSMAEYDDARCRLFGRGEKPRNLPERILALYLGALGMNFGPQDWLVEGVRAAMDYETAKRDVEASATA